MSTVSLPDNLLTFIDKSPTPYHAVESAVSVLCDAGFHELSVADGRLEWGKNYFFTQEGRSIFAFRLPSKISTPSFRIIGAHTDSPLLKLKPLSETKRFQTAQFAVEVYGGVLVNSWIDRDLSIAGKVIYKNDNGLLSSSLLHINQPLLRIPQLAIHLHREVNDEGFKINKETQLKPFVEIPSDTLNDSRVLYDFISKKLSLSSKQILSFDLSLVPVEKSSYGGFNNEYIFAPRLDNLAMCHAALSAITSAQKGNEHIDMIALFDHEEIGSVSSTGADSSVLKDICHRIWNALKLGHEEFFIAKEKSLFISADMAHALHPHYSEKHDGIHTPLLNNGPVIKVNNNKRYATDAEGEAILKLLCEQVEVNHQYYVCRSDLPCGSTIGPMSAAQLGIRCIDVGNPMLSMHSSREMAGSRDHHLMIRVLTRFFETEYLGW